MISSYYAEDVTLLLKDITGAVDPMPAKEREVLIQKGVHYCEMLPLEYKPTNKYMETYESALAHYAKSTADAVGQVAEKIYDEKGKEIVLVSLARAGVPIGILIKHYLEKKYHIPIFHYGISIIRGRGIDGNALKHILQKHSSLQIQFVDGWIGKGAIQKELTLALSPYKNISSELAVLSDPAHITELCGTHEDILIPSSCLNSTISGLISRTFLREDIIGPTDYHGAAFYRELEKEDVSYSFIHAIEAEFDFNQNKLEKFAASKEKSSLMSMTGLEEVCQIAEYYQIKDINLIKPGIGEATRVLLRRVPWKLIIMETMKDDPGLVHLLRLAKEKDVPVDFYPLKNYKACGIIKSFGDI